MFPDFASIETIRHDVPFSVAVVTKTRSSQTIGDDQPTLGSSVFHTTFDSALQCNGTFFSVEIPWRVGPRKDGQFSARLVSAKTPSSRMATDFTRSQLNGASVMRQKKLSCRRDMQPPSRHPLSAANR